MTGIMIAWWALTIPSVIFVAVDIRHTPEATAMKWAFVIMTLFAGPLGAIFYVLGCREPLPGTHEEYTSPRWKQALGSTMHCAAGDGLGIIAGAAISASISLGFAAGVGLEYLLGFGFGWTFFQAFAMRDMAGGDYLKSLRMSFFPEFVSMNVLMGGMVITHMALMSIIPGAHDPGQPQFWFVMSMSLIVGFIAAYPMNWWLVSRHMKHGMITVRPTVPTTSGHAHSDHATDHGSSMESMEMDDQRGTKIAMVVVSVTIFTISIVVASAL